MKTIEEKAKAYDEALKAAIAAHKDEDRHLKATLERIFPELQESEDERIRKGLIKALSSIGKRNWGGIDVFESISWLEKQGEQKTVSKVKIGEKYRCCNSARYTCFQIGKVYKVKDSFDAAMISLCSDCFVLVDDSVEQKPAEWSDEDEYCIHQLIVFCENCMIPDSGAKRCAHWLKSLRPQSHWRPSDEQMIAIQEAMNIVGILTITGSKINSLYQDLKKLKE